MGENDGNILAFAQAQEHFRQEFDSLYEFHTQVAREVFWRKGIAYGLKGTAVFGAFAIATGLLNEGVAHGIGVVIGAAVIIDQISSNYARLLAVDGANKASRALTALIKYRHGQAINSTIKAAPNDPSNAADGGVVVLQQLTAEIFNKREAIRQSLDQADTTALKRLTLEVKEELRTAAAPHQANHQGA